MHWHLNRSPPHSNQPVLKVRQSIHLISLYSLLLRPSKVKSDLFIVDLRQGKHFVGNTKICQNIPNAVKWKKGHIESVKYCYFHLADN